MSLWLGILASSKKISSIVAQFLYGTSSGKLYAIDSGVSTEVTQLKKVLLMT